MAKIKVIADGGSPKMDEAHTVWFVIQKGDKPRAHRSKYDKVFEIDEEAYNMAYDGKLLKKSLVIVKEGNTFRCHLAGEDTDFIATEV